MALPCLPTPSRPSSRYGASGVTLPSGLKSDFRPPIIDKVSLHLALALPCCSATSSGHSRQQGECQPAAAGDHVSLADVDLRLHLGNLEYVYVL